jgi:hypothetical protein
MLDVEDWAEIRRMHRGERMPIKVIARVLGISKNTVKAALASDGPPKYERAPAGSAVDEVEPRIRELLKAVPTMPATVIAERIGWTRGMTVLTGRVRELTRRCLLRRKRCFRWSISLRMAAGIGHLVPPLDGERAAGDRGRLSELGPRVEVTPQVADEMLARSADGGFDLDKPAGASAGDEQVR